MITMLEPTVIIGSRHIEGHVIRRDTHAGTYEEINSPVTTLVEKHAQHALLNRKPPSNLDRLWNQKRVANDACTA